MNPATLHSLSGARSPAMPIDESRTVDGLERLLSSQRERIEAMQTRVYTPAEWTLAECGQACGGMPQRHYYALRYSYGLDDSVRSALWGMLMNWATKQAVAENWPETVKTVEGADRRYIADLVKMALLEERAPWYFVRNSNEPDLRRLLMNVAEHTWRRHVSKMYEAIRTEYIAWLCIGEGMMRERMSNSA